ncbi:MAG: lipase family protein [Bradymonadia bacterium]
MKRNHLVTVLGAMLSMCMLAGVAGAKSKASDNLSTARSYGADLLRTAIAMQRHTEWVSSAKDVDIKRKLERKGYRLVGDVIHGKGGSGLQAYVAVGGDNVVVAFRGTKSDKLGEFLKNVKTDLKFLRMVKLKFSKKHGKVKVHKGFYDDYVAVRKQIIKRVKKHKGKRIYVTGFSLGGALASLCALDLKENVGGKVFAYFLGNPRAGGEDFRQALLKTVGQTLRIALNRDIVPKVPGISTQISESRYQHNSQQLLQLYPNGVRVPDGKLDPRIRTGSFDFHDRDKYRDALKAHYETCKKDKKTCSGNALKSAAKAERAKALKK